MGCRRALENLMRRAFLAIAVSAVSLFAGQAAAQGSWKVETEVDPLDPQKKTTFVSVLSQDGVSQFGRQIKVHLAVLCRNSALPDVPRALGSSLYFGERVAVGDRLMRWRVDEFPIRQTKQQFFYDGKGFILSSGGRAPKERDFISELRKGKTLKVQYDLPWAGEGVFTFNLAGADDAFSQIPCGPELRQSQPKK
jgi:hypothetical protein